MSFLNTEQTYSNSGTAGTFLAPNIAFSASRNSGGQVNIAGPAIVKAIYAQPVSGFTGAGTSGQVLIACNCVSGATSGANTAGDILYLHHGGGVAISGAVQTQQPLALVGLDYLCRSGIATFVTNSGSTYAYTLTVLYAAAQA